MSRVYVPQSMFFHFCFHFLCSFEFGHHSHAEPHFCPQADFCHVPCHYTHDYRNPVCVNNQTSATPTTAQQVPTNSTTKQTTTGPPTTIQLSTRQPVQCDPRCTKIPGQGTCLSDGQCLCWWGWTGPSSTYITSGVLKNRSGESIAD